MLVLKQYPLHCVERRLWVVGVTIKPSDDGCSGHETTVIGVKVHLRLARQNR